MGRTEYDDGMPHRDTDGRMIVKVKAENENGWRYHHLDSLEEGDEVIEGPPDMLTTSAGPKPADWE